MDGWKQTPLWRIQCVTPVGDRCSVYYPGHSPDEALDHLPDDCRDVRIERITKTDAVVVERK